jgi:hypothetical protein
VAYRGYVQVALNLGLFEAFPAQAIKLENGSTMMVPGPRFEPATNVDRAGLAIKLSKFRQLFITGA